mmetsp:Transcript_40701/g.93549  ORF Transcript_40701/g.93549 Transcript_40701/m.93549 type:complete len:886 (-) Transcript_40701:38-2695(-)
MAAELAVAAAAGVAGGVHGVWGYNRSNFMYDREMRQKTEFQILGYRNVQADLWREDVRALISLTERKMDSYLIVNSLQLGMCVMLFAEGRLDPGTPAWVLHIYMLALGAAFLYLLMSVWLAMHASIVAQVSGVRLLTQHVRLPVPSIEQLDAMRTYAISYEQLGVKSMMRVPFISKPGRREKHSTGTVSDAASSVAGESRDAPRSLDSRAPELEVHDPWGLEEQGCPYELEAVKPGYRRHIQQAARQATQYQGFDAFARVSMSFGTNQLLCAITYYCLGYVSVLDGAPFAATTVAFIMVGIALALIELDFDLSRSEATTAWGLLAAGPAIFTCAACFWCTGDSFSHVLVPLLLPFGFAAHGMSLVWLLRGCKVELSGSGVWLPTKFVAVQNLDVFGWMSDPQGQGGEDELQENAPDDESMEVHANPPWNFLGARESSREPMLMSQQNVEAHCRHLEATEKHAAKEPLRARIQAAIQGAGLDLPKRGTAHTTLAASAAAARDAQGAIPWLALRSGTCLLSALWILGFIWSIGFLLASALPIAMGGERDLVDMLRGSVLSMAGMKDPSTSDAMPLSKGAMVHILWPRRFGFVPTASSCDLSGQHLVVADGFGVYAGSLTEDDAVNTSLHRMLPCAAFEGHMIQDMSVACHSRAAADASCSVMVLHGHGKSLTDCPLVSMPQPAAVHEVRLKEKPGTTWTISQEWLDAPNEEVVSVAVDAECLRKHRLDEGSAAHFQSSNGCVVAGTSTGRVVRLRRHLADEKQLVPDVDIKQRVTNATSPPGLMHHFMGNTALLLWPQEGQIQALNLEVGDVVGEWQLPKDRRWTSLAGSTHDLFLVGHPPNLTRQQAASQAVIAELWRFAMPPEMQQVLAGTATPRQEFGHGQAEM